MRLLFKLESRAGHPRQRVNDVKYKKVCGMPCSTLYKSDALTFDVKEI